MPNPNFWNWSKRVIACLFELQHLHLSICIGVLQNESGQAASKQQTLWWEQKGNTVGCNHTKNKANWCKASSFLHSFSPNLGLCSHYLYGQPRPEEATKLPTVCMWGSACCVLCASQTSAVSPLSKLLSILDNHSTSFHDTLQQQSSSFSNGLIQLRSWKQWLRSSFYTVLHLLT